MDSDEPLPGTNKLMARHAALEEEAAYWYSGDDPVLRDIVWAAITALAPWLESDTDPRRIRADVEQLESILDQTKDWPDAVIPSGHVEQDEAGDPHFVLTDTPVQRDHVDQLLAPSIISRLERVGLSRDIALQLLTLSEARANRPSIAQKASRKSETEPTRLKEKKRRATSSKGGKKSGLATGIQEATNRIVAEHPDWSVERIWQHFPESPSPLESSGFTIYRDGDTLIQTSPNDKQRTLKRKSFRPYVERAKKPMQ